jgi:hypothetical protein
MVFIATKNNFYGSAQPRRADDFTIEIILVAILSKSYLLLLLDHSKQAACTTWNPT